MIYTHIRVTALRKDIDTVKKYRIMAEGPAAYWTRFVLKFTELYLS